MPYESLQSGKLDDERKRKLEEGYEPPSKRLKIFHEPQQEGLPNHTQPEGMPNHTQPEFPKTEPQINTTDQQQQQIVDQIHQANELNKGMTSFISPTHDGQTQPQMHQQPNQTEYSQVVKTEQLENNVPSIDPNTMVPHESHLSTQIPQMINAINFVSPMHGMPIIPNIPNLMHMSQPTQQGEVKEEGDKTGADQVNLQAMTNFTLPDGTTFQATQADMAKMNRDAALRSPNSNPYEYPPNFNYAAAQQYYQNFPLLPMSYYPNYPYAPPYYPNATAYYENQMPPINYQQAQQQMPYKDDQQYTPETPPSPVPTTDALLQKLSASKSPVLESLIYCALNKWGLELVSGPNEDDIAFKVHDFDLFCKYSTIVNSKASPTNDLNSRIKALNRWFDGIPKVKARKLPFVIKVKGGPDKRKKVREMIQKMQLVHQERMASM